MINNLKTNMKKHQLGLIYTMLAYILYNVSPYQTFWFSVTIGWCVFSFGYYIIEIIKNKED